MTRQGHHLFRRSTEERPGIHYGPGEDLERIDVALLREATKQIDMAAYVLTDTAVIEAFGSAAKLSLGSFQILVLGVALPALCDHRK